MYQMNVHVMGLKELEMRLGKLAPEAKRVMRIAVNDTARQTRTMLNNEVRQRYVVKRNKVNKAVKLIPATNATLTAILASRGKPLPLSDFQVRKNGKRKAGQGHQLHGTSLSQIIKEGNKSFMTNVSNHTGDGDTVSHKGLFFRVSKKRFPIRQVYGSSVPVMLGGANIYGRLEPEIHEKLQDNLQKHIDLVLRRF